MSTDDLTARLLIDGVLHRGDHAIEVRNPATGSVFAEAAAASRDQAEAAIAAAKRAQPAWEVLGWPAHGTDYRHMSCTARMGQNPDAVVSPDLRVHGIDRLRIADASVLPRVRAPTEISATEPRAAQQGKRSDPVALISVGTLTTCNTMAPCVIIGERAADLASASHRPVSASAHTPASKRTRLSRPRVALGP